MNTTIDTVIFDLGNVLLLFDFDLAADRLCALTGKSRREFDDYVVATPFIMQLETGAMSKEQAFAMFVQDFGFAGNYAEFAKAWSEIFSPNDPMIAFFRKLKGRYRRYLLSNTNVIHMDYVRATYPFIGEFDGLGLSYELGLAKPDPAIYRATLKKFKLDASRSVFLDDIRSNVEGARSVGIHGIHFQNTDQALRELANLGVTVE